MLPPSVMVLFISLGKGNDTKIPRPIKNTNKYYKNHQHRHTLSSHENHLSEDVENGEAEEGEDVLHVVEGGSSYSFYILIGAGLTIDPF